MQEKRSSIPLLIVIILALCLCITVLGVWMWNFVYNGGTASDTPTAAAAATATAPAAQQPTADEASQGTPTAPLDPPTAVPAAGSESLPAGLASEMDAIQEQVVQIRGLQPAGTFTRAIFSPEDLRERVINDFFADYTPEEAQEDTMVLALLGLLEPGYDLMGLYTELFSEQVAGFYDHETKEMVVVGSETFGGPEKLTYAHEYNHALQDENYDIENGLNYNDDACEIDSERCAAIQALIEGDASLLELQWFFNYATDDDQQQVFDYYGSLTSPVFDSAPPFLQEDFIFPYDEGYLFVESLFNAGGWERVDEAYANLPVSTEQILHPDKYPGEPPIPVSLPDLLPVLGEGWELLEDNVMGEWYTQLILGFGINPASQLPVEQAAAAAAGWGGDRYAVYINRSTGGLVLALKSVWDSSADQDEFAAAFRAYGDLRFGAGSPQAGGAALWQAPNSAHLFTETASAAFWVAAPDAQTAAAVLAAVTAGE